MTLHDILLMWEADSEIDSTDLGSSSLHTARLHAKYLRLLVDAKFRKSKAESDFSILRKQKYRYLRGEMTREELKEKGWEPWQFAKPLKAEMDEYLNGDEELSLLQNKIEANNIVIQALESILAQIKSRDWQIRNAITWKQFLAGG